MTDPYFLTRQSANLMEDFVREIGRGSSFFLLFGEAGVGKTSLLKRIRDRRLIDTRSHWLDFSQAANADEVSSSAIDRAGELKTLAENALAGDVIFVDHFEDATNRAQHQLFESWAIDGRDQNLNFIVAADIAGFSAFKQLAQQFQIEVQSFQLMPLNQAEAESYLQSALFPEEPFAKLVISRSLKKQLRACKGIFSRLVAFKERDGALIEIDSNTTEKSSPAPTVIVTLLVLVLALVGYLYYSTQMQEQRSPSEIVSKSGPETKNQEHNIELLAEPIETQPVNQPLQVDNQAIDKPPANEAPEAVAVELEESAPEVVEPPVDRPVQAIEKQPEIETVTELKPESSWFQTMLDDSLSWIKNGENQRGTIQIMSIGFDQHALTAYKDYLEALQAASIDITKLNIYKTIANDKVVYSIVYGEYPSWQEARQQIKSLPEILAAAKPIARTTGSISKEIDRIADQKE